MMSRTEGCLGGGVGCVALVFVLALVLGVLGVPVSIRGPVGVAIVLFAIGGTLGFTAVTIYESGYRAGGEDALLEPPTPEPPSPKAKRLAAFPPFKSAWTDGSEPSTNREALESFSGLCLDGVRHELRVDEERTVIRLGRPRDVDRVLEIIAGEDDDEIFIRIHDDLGEIVTSTGPWRGADAPNAGLKALHGILEGFCTERLVHTLSASGEHSVSAAAQLDPDPDLRVRSWLGNLDRG